MANFTSPKTIPTTTRIVLRNYNTLYHYDIQKDFYLPKLSELIKTKKCESIQIEERGILSSKWLAVIVEQGDGGPSATHFELLLCVLQAHALDGCKEWYAA